MPAWKPGQSGNPSGRPRLIPSAGLARFIRENSDSGTAMAKLYFDVMYKRGQGANATLDQRMQAAEWLTSRGYGKAVDVSLTAEMEGGENPLALASTDELRALIRVARSLPITEDAVVEAVEAPPRDAVQSPLPPQPPSDRCASCGLRRAHNLDCPNRPKPAL